MGSRIGAEHPMENLIAFTLAAVALVGSPGPATLSLAATGTAFGVRRGLGYLLGIEIGMIVIMGVTASGVMGIVMTWPNVTPLITGLGAAYILYLAYTIATANVQENSAEPQRMPSFLGGLFLSLVNPKAYASLAALFSGFVLIPDQLVEDAVAKGLVLLVILTVVDLAWLSAGAVFMRRIKSPRTHKIINRVFALGLVASVAFVAL